MPFECPNCRTPVLSNVKMWLWVKWRCKNCDSLLGYDKIRRVTIVFGVGLIPIGFYLVFHRYIMPHQVFFFFAFAAFVIVVKLLWGPLDRAIVLERRGTYCQVCGYNLEGNTSGVCPECGTPTKSKDESLSG